MPEKVTFHIDGQKMDVAEATFEVNALKTDLGIPKMELPIVTAKVRINLNDNTNVDFNVIQKLFDLSTALRKQDRIKPIKLEFWQDLSKENPTVCYSFNGWISAFRTSNVAGDRENGRDKGRYNHVIDLELTPDTTEGNFKSVKVGN